jgi:hypothetical protein
LAGRRHESSFWEDPAHSGGGEQVYSHLPREAAETFPLVFSEAWLGVLFSALSCVVLSGVLRGAP